MAGIQAKGKETMYSNVDMNLRTTELVISVCSLKDIDTWSVAAEYIVRNVESQSFMLIVPHDNLGDFIKCTPGEVEVISEEEIIPSSYIKFIEKYLDHTTNQITRGGWIYQQFLKIQGAINSSKDRIALWDADTVPLKKISFFDDKLRARFYTSSENHPPYFDMINSILGNTNIYKDSFIAQSIPFRRQWIIDLCREIETNTGTSDWKLGILNCITSELGPSPFSEYETIGTYAISRLNENDRPIPQARPQSWARNGYELIGPASNLSFFNHALLRDAEFVSFERCPNPFSHYIKPTHSQMPSSSDTKIPIRFKLLLSIASNTVKLNFDAVQMSIKYLTTPDLYLIFDCESEDNRLKRFMSDFFSASPHSTILHIGNNHGIINESIRSFLPGHKGQIILVEELPYYCDKLKQLYSSKSNVQVVNASIASKEYKHNLTNANSSVMDEIHGDKLINDRSHGSATFVKDSTISSIHRNPVTKSTDSLINQRFTESFASNSIPTISLACVAQKWEIIQIELLVIDVHGTKLEALSSLHELDKLPRFIVYKDNSSSIRDEAKKLESLLANFGYVYITGKTSRLWGLDSNRLSRSSLGL